MQNAVARAASTSCELLWQDLRKVACESETKQSVRQLRDEQLRRREEVEKTSLELQQQRERAGDLHAQIGEARAGRASARRGDGVVGPRDGSK